LRWFGGYRLGLACRRRRFVFASRFAAEPRLAEDAPNAAAAALQAFLRQQMLDAARAIRATALGNRARDHVR